MSEHDKASPLTRIVDRAAKLAGGQEWLIPVSIELENGTSRVEEIMVVANSEEEAQDAAVARAKMLYVEKKRAKEGKISKIIAAPYTKEKSMRAIMPGGYMPGTLLRGSLGDMVTLLRRNKSPGKEDHSVVGLETRCRNSFISMCIHLFVIPVGLLFFYVGLFTGIEDKSALGYLNQYVWAGALCLFVGTMGAYKCAMDVSRLEKQMMEGGAAND